MRKGLLLLVCLSCLCCVPDREGTGVMTDFIPENTAILIKLNRPDLFSDDLRNNAFIEQNNSHPILKGLEKRFSAFKHFSTNNSAYFAISGDDQQNITYTYISKEIPEAKDQDSVPAKELAPIGSGSARITPYVFENDTTYTGVIDHIFIAGNSREAIQNILNGGRTGDPANTDDLEKALKAASDEHAVVFLNHNKISEIFPDFLPEDAAPFLNNFSNWTVLDTDISQNRIKFDGITTAGDTLPKFINLFKGVEPGRNELAQVTPLNSHGFLSYAFRDFEPLHQNLLIYNDRAENQTTSELLLLETLIETGMIYTTTGNVFALRVLNSEAAQSFSDRTGIAEDFRGTPIFINEQQQAFSNIFKPLLSPENLRYFVHLRDFLLFSEDMESLKEIISTVQNENTFSKNKAYLSSSENLSSEASVLWVANNSTILSLWADQLSGENKNAINKIETGKFPFSAFQLIYSNNFAHVHAVLEKNEQKLNSAGVKETASISLEAEVAGPPSLIKNHRTKGMDVAVQDTNNNLYLISNNGNIHWKKQLESRILGPIQQVDIFRNGRIQLSFTTPNKIQIIDREGNEVKPFPLTFRDDITQPLAIFDYDNNRKYRFVVVQGSEVFMYDNKGNRVKGFGFTKATDKISHSPKHIRMGNKDYIVIPEASGKINILDRRGNIRVPVREEIELSGNNWYEYKDQFVTTNRHGELVKINQNGAISRDPLNLTENHTIDATAKTLVTLSENQLSIKDKKVELDYGLYTDPKIFVVNNKIYINVTDTQSQRVFLFDSNASLLPGFPVYGTSEIDLDNMDSDSNLEFVVKGEDNSLLLYEVRE